MKKNLTFISFLFIAVFGMATFSSPVFAAVQGVDLGSSYPAESGLSNLDPRIMVAQIIRIALSLLGTVFLVIVLYGGYLWMTAGGKEEQIGDAKRWIYSGVIGIAIILSSYGITTFVLSRLTSATL